MVHGDDYMCVGPEPELIKLREALAKTFGIKHSILGSADHLDKEGRILNRIIRVDASGWHLEADQRHGELIVKEMGLDKCKGLPTPGVDDHHDSEDVELMDWRATQFRSLAARANDLALDRPDIQYAVKELCRTMSRPTESSWRKLTRVAKYLIYRPRMVLDYLWQEEVSELSTYSDANWAGCVTTRKSTSGGVVMAGTHLIKTWSKTQSNIALSSAESEFYATLKSAQESLGIMALAQEFGVTLTTRMHVDASAALGVAQRTGLGKLRHLQTGALWLQEQELKKVVRLGKINGADNMSDIGTKKRYLGRSWKGT